MRISTSFVAAAAMLFAGSVAWAMPSGPSGMRSGGRFGQSQSPEERAKSAYSAGLDDMKKADGYEESATKESDAKKQDKARRKAHNAYLNARNEFQETTKLVPKIPEPWNN